MFSQTQFQTLFAYHWHVTFRLLECAAQIDESAYRDNPGYGRGSIHDTLFHLLQTDQGWRLGLETGRQQAPLPAEDYASLAALRAGFEQEQATWQALLEGLSPKEIEGDLNLTDRRGQAWTLSYWRVLQHLVLHGMQHHAELAGLLTARGQSPGDIDFLFYQG